MGVNRNQYVTEDSESAENRIFSRMINFRKIKAISFEEAIESSKIRFTPWKEVYEFADTAEAAFEGDYSLSYVLYKFQKLYKTIPKFLCISDELIKEDFFDKFYEKMNIPYNSIDFNHTYDNSGVEINRFFISMERMIFFYDGQSSYIIYSPELLQDQNSSLYDFFGIIKKYRVSKVNKNKIFIVYRTQYGFQKKAFNVKKRNIEITENYNDDFTEVSNDIIAKLNDLNKTGLVILHGEPGTGKTTYIRYLAGRLKRNIIFISPDMVHHITSPEFIPFLLDNSNSILIIEDAEPAIQRRNGDGRSGAVSNILNMTDGLLSDCLNISVVATFNTTKKDIDEALLRKGRLLKAYKFDKLEPHKATNLLIKLGKIDPDNRDPKKEISRSLAEIYFYGDSNKKEEFESKSMGFSRSES